MRNLFLQRKRTNVKASYMQGRNIMLGTVCDFFISIIFTALSVVEEMILKGQYHQRTFKFLGKPC